MDKNEIQQLVNQLRIQLANEPKVKEKGPDAIDEAILDIFFEAFVQGKMDRFDLKTLFDFMGYELPEGFMEDPTPDPITQKKGNK